MNMVIQGKDHNQIHISPQITRHKKVTYVKKDVSIRTIKAKKYRLRLKIGGDRLEFNEETKTK